MGTEARRLLPHDRSDAEMLLQGQGERQACESCADDDHLRLGHVTERDKVLWELTEAAGSVGDLCGSGGGGAPGTGFERFLELWCRMTA